MVKGDKLRQPSPRYGDVPTFQDGGRRHLGFLKCEILTIGRLRGANCVAVPNLVEIRQTAADIMVIFQDGGAAILDFF